MEFLILFGAIVVAVIVVALWWTRTRTPGGSDLRAGPGEHRDESWPSGGPGGEFDRGGGRGSGA